jgi:hypothetical protein
MQGERYAKAFAADQTQTLLFLNPHAQAFNIYPIFIGFWSLVTSYLILRSRFFPRVVGASLMLDGLGVPGLGDLPVAAVRDRYLSALSSQSSLASESYRCSSGSSWLENTRSAGRSNRTQRRHSRV